MSLEIAVSEDHVGAVTSDLARRRCQVKSLDARDKMRRITGEVPLDYMRGYASRIRSLTQGRCSFMLKFKRYSLVPAERAREIVSQREGKVAVR